MRSAAIADAERDAENDIDTNAWFVGGCLGVGVVAAPVAEPKIPTERLTGKSPEYVAFYTDAYIEKAQALQSRSAQKGCIVSGVIAVAASVAVLIGGMVVLSSFS